MNHAQSILKLILSAAFLLLALPPGQARPGVEEDLVIGRVEFPGRTWLPHEELLKTSGLEAGKKWSLEAGGRVDTSKTSIKDGDMYAIDHDGMLRIKLLYRMPGNSLKIVSYNKDEWPDELLAPDEAQKVRIIGRVFWWSTLR